METTLVKFNRTEQRVEISLTSQDMTYPQWVEKYAIDVVGSWDLFGGLIVRSDGPVTDQARIELQEILLKSCGDNFMTVEFITEEWRIEDFLISNIPHPLDVSKRFPPRTILGAFYYNLDVTDIVTHYANIDGHFNVRRNLNDIFGDPNYGSLKVLNIIYVNEFSEIKRISLPESTDDRRKLWSME
jgi:hypothetical protein